MTDTTQNSFWRDAARAGLVLGLVIVAFTFAAHYTGLDDNAPGTVGVFNFIASAATIYIYGRHRAVRRGEAGFTFGESLRYSLAIMLFAGFVVGVGQWILFTWVTPETYAQAIEVSIARTRELFNSLPQEQIDQGIEAARRISTSPIFIIFTYILNMLINGLLIGLVAALFIRTERETGHRIG